MQTHYERYQRFDMKTISLQARKTAIFLMAIRKKWPEMDLREENKK